MIKWMLRLVLSAALVFRDTGALPQLIPDDPYLHYTGRWDRSDSSYARASWVLSSVSCRVSNASAVSALLTAPAGGARLKVVINGVTSKVMDLGAGSNRSWYPLIESLPGGTNHTLQLLKVTENFPLMGSENAESGVMEFGGFRLDAGGKFIAPFTPLGRRLEFIGDSDTAGWCANGTAIKGLLNPEKFQDASMTWAAQLSTQFKAEASVTAVSGWGVTNISHPIQSVYNYTNGAGNRWNFSWVPDAVIILIGPNDQRGLPAKMAPDFGQRYLELLRLVGSKYRHTGVKLINVCGGSINGLAPCKQIKAASDKFGTSSHYVTISESTWKKLNSCLLCFTKYNGCEKHYNPSGHAILAQSLLPQMRKILGW